MNYNYNSDVICVTNKEGKAEMKITSEGNKLYTITDVARAVDSTRLTIWQRIYQYNHFESPKIKPADRGESTLFHKPRKYYNQEQFDSIVAKLKAEKEYTQEDLYVMRMFLEQTGDK